MAQREGSVFLILFIATFVLFLASVVLFFMENAARKELEVQLVRSKKETTDQKNISDGHSKQLTELRRMVGGQEAATAWPQNEFYEGKRKDAEDFLNELFRKEVGRPAKSFNDLVEPLADYKDIVKKILETRQQAMEKQKRAEEEQVADRASHKAEVDKKEEIITGLKTQITETESRYERRISDQTKEAERLQKELATAKDQMATAEIASTRQRTTDQNIINTLRVRLDQLTEESRKTKTIEDVDPDAQILQVASASQIGWINIGRKNHLRPGLEFRVFQNVKGGKRQYKGTIEVRRVDESISEFRIVDVDDELNPITQGDMVTSPFYDPKQVPVFVFAGEGLESRDVTEESLRAKIQSYGAQIKGEVDLKTSFLIALKDYEKSPLYKTARELGVAVLRERDVLEYMGF